MFKKIILNLLFLCLFSINALGQEFQGKFANWVVFATDFGKKKICYMVSLPIKKVGNYYKRGEPYFIITNSVDNIDEVTISAGYLYKKGSEVELSFGLKKFSIFTYKNLAWAYNKTDDIDIIKEMRRNLDIVVLGVNKNNRYSQDSYSLVGFNQAFTKMKKECKTNYRLNDV